MPLKKSTPKKSTRKQSEKKPARRAKADDAADTTTARSRTTATRRRGDGSTARARGKDREHPGDVATTVESTLTSVKEAEPTIAPPPPPSAPPRDIRPASSGATVEEVDGKIVIRFPPVAPHPFPAPEVAPVIPVGPAVPVAPAARGIEPPAAPSAAPPPRHDDRRDRDDRGERDRHGDRGRHGGRDARDRDHGRRDDRRDDRRGNRRDDRAPERRDDRPVDRRDDRAPDRRDDRAPHPRDDRRDNRRDEHRDARRDAPPVPIAREVAPPAGVTPAGEEGSGEYISPSKRRRMRRRRRRGQLDGGPMDGGQPAGAPSAATPIEETEGAEIDGEEIEDHVVVDEPVQPREPGPMDDLAEDDEARPWLSAAESIREEISQSGGATEVVDADDEARDEDVEPGEVSDTAVATPRGREDDRERGRRRRRGRGGRGGRGRGGRDDRDRDRGEVRLEREPRGEGEPASTAPTGGSREMVINAIPREECRIAILQGGRLEEIYMERATAENHVGNIYKGVVTNVEASIQAAFIDFGQGKNGFLHISDLHPQYFPDGQGQTENVGHKMPRRHRPPIQKCLRRGQEMIVQVTKEGIGTKGPTLSTYLSIPGRFLVMMPGMGKIGVSRRIEDDDLRDSLRNVLAELELPEGMGFIARTAALDREKGELQNDLNYLTRLWRAVENRTKNDPAPAELYRESDLVIRTIRDVYTDDVERIVVDDPDVAQRARGFLGIFSPHAADLVTVFDGAEPIFHKYGIEQELERLHSRRVPLGSGGSLVIEPTEALVAIDVNSGSFRTEDDAENTAYKINCEAADEIARQLRLRDLGGVIICDFIDMRFESHRREIERRLTRSLREHKERVKVLRMSEFGIIELTRQRQRASLTRSVYQDCRHCRGTGLVKTIESVALDVMRLIQLAVTRQHIATVEVTISTDVAYLLQNRKRRLLHELETNNRRTISIRSDPNFSLDQVEMRCTDARGRLVPHM